MVPIFIYFILFFFTWKSLLVTKKYRNEVQYQTIVYLQLILKKKKKNKLILVCKVLFMIWNAWTCGEAPHDCKI